MSLDDDAPTDLEMDLRRNLTPCRCKHAFMYHDIRCSECKCVEFREQY